MCSKALEMRSARLGSQQLQISSVAPEKKSIFKCTHAFFPDFVSAWQVRLYGAKAGLTVQM